MITTGITKNISIVASGDLENMPIYSVNRSDKKIALTFDINWAENDNIYSILDILDEYNVKATFFVIGGWVEYSEKNKEELIAIYQRGNEIGNHSFKHPMFTSISKSRMEKELKQTDDVIYKYTGEKPTLFRFPSGDYNKESYNFVTSLGYTSIQWDVDSIDWREDGADAEYQRLKKGIKPGSIILFHNGAKYTCQNLRRIISEYKSEGYEFTKVSDMIYPDSKNTDKNGTQILGEK